MSRPRAGAAALAAVALAAVPAGAAATEGSLYPFGASIWAVSPQVTGDRVGAAIRVRAPHLEPAHAGNIFEMNWGCPVPGSEIHAVQFGGLRTQAPSSLAVRVTGNRQVLWAIPDAALPQSPAGGLPLDVRLPGGQCDVHLTLTQVETRTQHQRAWFIDNPRILVRDLTAPAVTLTSLPVGWVAAPRLRVGWRAHDNFGSDGMRAHRVSLAGTERWRGAPGQGDHAIDLDLAGIPDGPHQLAVVVEGDGTAAGAAAGVVYLDRTPPRVTRPAAALTEVPGATAFSWAADDDMSTVGASLVEVNAAADGSASGSWVEVARTTGGGGQAALGASAGLVPDGVHAWRVRAVDLAGNVAVAPGLSPVVVDTTPPLLILHSAPTGWVSRLSLDITATDNLQAALGLGATEIDVNTATDGGETGGWVRAATVARAPGRRTESVDLAGVEDGRHLVRVRVRNGGPLGARLVAERTVTVKVDLTPPSLARAAFATSAGGVATVSWLAEDALSGVAAASVQWRDGSGWRTIAAEAAGEGAGSISFDTASLPRGDRPVRLAIADAAGNVATHGGTITGTGPPAGLGSAAGDPAARLRGARLRVSMPGARATRARGRRVLVRTIRVGRPIVVAGRLLDARGRPVRGAEIVVQGHRRRVIGRARTGADGRFRARAMPRAGALLRIGVPVAGGVLPAWAQAELRVRVRPRLSIAASSTRAGPGERVVFRGRLTPSPAEVALGARKGVVLEWLDPIRRTWRPVVNARLRRDGSFAIPWRYGLRGLTIPMRARVPAEVGWPFLPARSRVIGVSLR